MGGVNILYTIYLQMYLFIFIKELKLIIDDILIAKNIISIKKKIIGLFIVGFQ